MTIEDLTTDFLEEARNEQKESAFVSKRSGNRKKETRDCYKCGKKGHIAKDCWSKKQAKAEQNKTDSKLNMTASVFDHDGNLKKAWLIDSGASSHVCCQEDLDGGALGSQLFYQFA
ncbi:hypothetical protein V1524DRAFT_443561 [Lipomyces starkeyi]